MIRIPRLETAVVALAAVGLIAGAAMVVESRDPVARAAQEECPPGYERVTEREMTPEMAAQLPAQYQGGEGLELGSSFRGACLATDRPEPFRELALRDMQQSSIRTAPYDSIHPDAPLAAAMQRQELVARAASVPGSGGVAQKYGLGPQISNDPRYPSTSGNGIVHSTGRIDDLKYDPPTGRLFAAIGTGGVWLSEDLGESWRPITDNLPSTVVSSVAYTRAGGPDGTIVAVTGEHTFGGFAFTGIGVWYSRDLGETWQRSSGPPSGTLGFAAEVDPTNPNVIYAATGNGLWRSTDAGATFRDVKLPTGDCAGDYNDDTCNFANFVTDVVVQHPGGTTDVPGGAVVAAVGWRAGEATNPDGNVQSEHNGLYYSDTGQPGTFAYEPGLEAAIPDSGDKHARIGRIEMGPAVGDAQDHNYLYLIMEDAVLFNGGARFSPIPDDFFGSNPTFLSGVYVSDDFGKSWELLADDVEIAKSCPANNSVFCIPGLVEPGIQSWFNLWVHPDPTQAVGGVPSRLLFGLEEVWQSREVGPHVNNASTSFEVIGRYYGSGDCLLVATDCSVNREVGITTTHPDHHAGLILPRSEEEGGGSLLLVGHDGGLSTQMSSGSTDPFDQNSWQLTQFNGLQTLLPYSSVIANDGVAYAGLQDNGQLRVTPDEGFAQYATYGADGTFTAVDPENSDYVIESTQNAGMNVSTDGGQTWRGIAPPADNVRFVNPFVMDPLDANHLATGGRQIVESTAGPNTANGDEGNEWKVVFDLRTTERDPQHNTADQPEPPSNGMSAIDTRGPGTYVGFCGVCDILNADYPFQNGIATNVSGQDLPEPGTSKGWHFAAAEGLPNRYITSVAIDPRDETLRTIYVTLGGYSRAWVPPGAAFDENNEVGEGHLYKSTDAGETFVDISGNLPDIPATWVEPRGDQLLVGTDQGAYITSDTNGGPVAPLAPDVLPSTPVTSIQLKPDDPDFALIGLYGRGLWAYRFPDGDYTLRRLGGSDRIGTAVEISKAEFDSSDTVVIARHDVYADALAGSPLAAREDAPLLLTPTGALADAVKQEIDRLDASRAILLGGTAALSDRVEQDLELAGISDIERYEGDNRFGTAAAIAEELGGRNVYVTEGIDADPTRGWPDAMSISPVAAERGWPILLTDTHTLPGETGDALASLNANTATVVGGPVAVSEAVETELGKLVSVQDRIAGSDRYETSAKAAEAGRRVGLSTSSTWFARGGDFPDALAAGPTAARAGGVMILVPDHDLGVWASATFVDTYACSIDVGSILGGPQAIAAQVESQIRQRLGACVDTGPGAYPTPKPIIGPPPPPEPAKDTLAGPYGFEGGADGWTVTTPSPGVPATAWERQQGNGHGGSDWSFNVIPYGEEVETILTSPKMTAPGGTAFLSWWNTFDIEGGGFDEVKVEWSPNNSDWTSIATLGGQNVGYPEYGEMELEFAPPAGDLWVRFRFYSDEICSSTGTPVCARPDGYEGIRIDDVAFEKAS
ncbi:MAG: cell wall-binding repeat-containing protein [Actinobacteria bacterium]|nr:cell wall-binding repeat-containing protein [Actinomycetota bacterium]